MRENDIIKYDNIYYSVVETNKIGEIVDGVIVRHKTTEQWWSIEGLQAGIRTKRMRVLPGTTLLRSLLVVA